MLLLVTALENVLQYRKEIDGLRAIAVLPVILFHGGIGGFSGGYIGVDIFFVISGYLITTIILEEKKRNKFSIINFYERRARRILPALSVVLIATTIAAYILMPANLLQSYSLSLVSVTTFASNIFFYLTSGYFSAAADEKPLLHTWSLAVEEQYYLFFPVMIVLLWSLGKKWLISSIIIVAVISLLFAQFLSLRGEVDANFYLIFSRAWELFFGSVIAFMPLRRFHAVRWVNEMSGLVGLVMIAYSIMFFDDRTPFPGFYALIPVLGTCLIIIFVDSTSYVGRFLSTRVLVFTGLISYSLYLWHQPLFAFLRLKSIGEPPMYLFLGAIIATFVLAFLSWKYVERPFRNKTRFSRASIFQYSAASIALFLTVGLAGHMYNGFDRRFDVPNYVDSIKFSPKREACHTKGKNFLRPVNACDYFGKSITWATFGDSHTVELAYALARRLEKYDVGLEHLSFSGCPPSLLFEVKSPGCTKWINESLSYLEKNESIDNVLLGFRYSKFLFGNQLDSYPHLPDIDPGKAFTEAFRRSMTGEPREIYWQSFEKIVSRLLKAGKNVYLLYPVPELPVDINKAITPFSVFDDDTMIDLGRATSAEYYYGRNQFILSKLDSLVYGEKLHAVKPFNIMCDGDFCPAVLDGKSLYFDDHHVSLSGAELITGSINLEQQKLAKKDRYGRELE